MFDVVPLRFTRMPPVLPAGVWRFRMDRASIASRASSSYRLTRELAVGAAGAKAKSGMKPAGVGMVVGTCPE